MNFYFCFLARAGHPCLCHSSSVSFSFPLLAHDLPQLTTTTYQHQSTSIMVVIVGTPLLLPAAAAGNPAAAAVRQPPHPPVIAGPQQQPPPPPVVVPNILQQPQPPPAAGPRNLPRMFPGPNRIMMGIMIPFLTAIFQLVSGIRPHVEAGVRNTRKTAKWKEVFENFFHRTNGLGRRFEPWASDGWKKFKKSVEAAMKGHSVLYLASQDAGHVPTPIQVMAHDLQTEMDDANGEYEAVRQQQAAGEAARQQRLGAAEQGMGLTMPGRGVQAPSLNFPLTAFQQQALGMLGQQTTSPGNGKCSLYFYVYISVQLYI